MEFYLNKLFLLKRSTKMIILIIIDFFISIFSLWSSYSLRLGEIYNPLKIDIKLYVILFLIFIVIQFSFKYWFTFTSIIWILFLLFNRLLWKLQIRDGIKKKNT